MAEQAIQQGRLQRAVNAAWLIRCQNSASAFFAPSRPPAAMPDGEHSRIHCAGTRCADAVEPDAVVLEQAVENTPGEGAVRAAALQGEVDRLDLDLSGRRRIGACRRPLTMLPSILLLLVELPVPRKRRLSFTREMYGAGLTGGNADRVLCGCAPVIALAAAQDSPLEPLRAGSG